MQRARDASECQGQKGSAAGQLRGATASDLARPAVLSRHTCLSSLIARPLEAPGARQDEVRPSPAAIFERHKIFERHVLLRSGLWATEGWLCVPMLLFFTLSATYEMGPLCVPQPPKGSPGPDFLWPI